MTKLKAATDTIAELLVIYLVVVMFAATVFSIAENKNMGDSLYWAGITATTVGYGDISPVTVVGRITGVALANFSIFIIAPLIVVQILSKLVENKHEFTDEEQRYLLETASMIRRELEPKSNKVQNSNSQPQPQNENAPHSEAYFRPTAKKNG